MPDSHEAEQTVTFKYVQGADYRILPANGAFGGVTPRGRFIINFFVDTTTIPDSVTHEVTSAGKVGPEVSRAAEDARITRTLQVGVMMSLEEADSIADWIKRRLAEFREQKK